MISLKSNTSGRFNTEGQSLLSQEENQSLVQEPSMVSISWGSTCMIWESWYRLPCHQRQSLRLNTMSLKSTLAASLQPDSQLNSTFWRRPCVCSGHAGTTIVSSCRNILLLPVAAAMMQMLCLDISLLCTIESSLAATGWMALRMGRHILFFRVSRSVYDDCLVFSLIWLEWATCTPKNIINGASQK